MSSKELSLPRQETITTDIIRPTVSIAQTVSNECVKIAELSEQCKIAESLLKDYETKIQTLTSSKLEHEKLKSEFVLRNKINLTNSESLLQAKNELLKYKCQLKSDYISTENALKIQQLKFQRILLNYESEWQKTLKQYNCHPFVSELSQLEEENKILENGFENLRNLKLNSEREFEELQQKVWKKFVEKVVEFSKILIENKEVLSRPNQNVKLKSIQKPTQKPKVGCGFNFFRTEIPALNLETYASDAQRSSKGSFPVDVTMFDDLSIPTENLEIRNDEELFSFIQTDANDPAINENPQEEKMDVDQIFVAPSISPKASNEEEYQKPNTSGKDSEYFSQCQVTENQVEHWSRAQGDRFELEEVEGNSQGRAKRQKIREEKANIQETGKEGQESVVENEENSSDGSFEKQFGYHQKQAEQKNSKLPDYNENYGYQHDSRTPSVSSDEMFQPSNDNFGSPKQQQNPEKTSTNSFLDQDSGFKKFSGFFTMDNDRDSSKPSIFKLF